LCNKVVVLILFAMLAVFPARSDALARRKPAVEEEKPKKKSSKESPAKKKSSNAKTTSKPSSTKTATQPKIPKPVSKPTPKPDAPKVASGSSLPPVPLPMDPQLSADVAFTGAYRTLMGTDERKMTLRAEMVQVLTEKSASRDEEDTFAYVEMPDEKGWNLFYPADDRFSITITVIDDRSRLGAALVRAQRDGKPAEIIGRIKADDRGRSIKGMFSIDPSAPTYIVTIFSQESKLLAHVNAHVPRSLRLEFFDVRYGFQPYRPSPDADCPPCANVEVPPAEMGNPKSLEGRTIRLKPTAVQACVTQSYENISDAPARIQPSLALHAEESLRNSIAAWQDRLKERLWGDYQGKLFDVYYLSPKWIADMVPESGTILPTLTAAPKTQSCGHWHVEMTGEVVSILAVPAERVRVLRDWESRLRGVLRDVNPQQPLASASLALLLNERLSKSTSDDVRQLQGGDVLAVGDVWLLRSRLLKSEVSSKPLSRLVPANPNNGGN
jgi:hypothetical protein